jgi:hypothetical protein
MKTAWVSGIAACLLFAIASPSDAGHRYYPRGYSRSVRITTGYGGYGYGGYGSGYGNGYGALRYNMHTAPPFQYQGGYGGYGYDYHPGYYVSHGDHLDYVPGHYHGYPSGYYGGYGGW